MMAVTQVCYAATWRACHCNRPFTRKLPDWYRVLQVDERADFDSIKKRYRQLALLLHPDKNKHPNSDAAFKIITEAYACLSDQEKRDLFNLERRRSFCSNCNLKAQSQAAGHISRPVAKVPTPQTPKYWETDGFQTFRERAKATVVNLEREWGIRTSKWMHQLASVRQRYWNPSVSSFKCDTGTPDYDQHYTRKSKLPRSPTSKVNPTPKVVPGSKLNFNKFEARRVSTSDVQDERTEKLEDDSDVLFRRLRSEGSGPTKESPLPRDFCVHTRTPEAGHLLRPLGGRRVTRSSSVDRKSSVKLDAGSGYAMCMPRGRCLTKDPLIPTTPSKPSSVHSDRAFHRTSLSEHKRHSLSRAESRSEAGHFAVPRRSSSLRFENLDQSTKEDITPARSRSMSKTASESWTNRVKANPDLFDDVFTTIEPPTSQAPSRRKSSFSLLTPTDLTSAEPATVTPVVKGELSKMSDESYKIVREGSVPAVHRRNSSTEKDVKLTRVFSLSNTRSAEASPEARQPLGSRSENRVVNSDMTCNTGKVRASELEQLQDMEHQQKTEAITGILQRLRAEAKTVAASLDQLRESIAAENTTRRCNVYNGHSRSSNSLVQ